MIVLRLRYSHSIPIEQRMDGLDNGDSEHVV